MILISVAEKQVLPRFEQAIDKGRDQHPSIFSVHPKMSGIGAQILLEIVLYFTLEVTVKKRKHPLLHAYGIHHSPMQTRAKPTTTLWRVL